MAEGGLVRWIGYYVTTDEDIYMTDGSYIQVCNEIYPGKVTWVNGDHSAITTSTPGRWISKWNKYPLVEHNKDETPFGTGYAYYASTKILGSNSILCSGTRDFSVQNIPQATYTWTYSSNLSPVSLTNSHQFTVQRNGSSNGVAWVEVQVSTICSATPVSNRVYFTVGTPSPYLGGTFNDGGSGLNQPLESTYNEIYNKTVYITLSGSSNEFTWDGFYSNGNVTWYHPVGHDGLVINFGNPLPVYYGDYVGFSIHRTNACGTASEPLFFNYVGPSQYYRVAPNPVTSTFTVTKIEIKQKVQRSDKKNLNMDMTRLQIIDKMGNIVKEKTYSINTKSATIDVSSLKSDIYTLRIFMKNKVEVHKIVVQH